MAKKYIALEETSQAILAAAQQILTRVTKIDLVTSTVVTGNPFEITFGTIDELDITGTWNQAAACIEF